MSTYTEQDRAALSIRRGKVAAGMPDGQAKRDYIAKQGRIPTGSLADAANANIENETHNEETTQDLGKALGSFKKGGRVPKTGLYKMHKGELVVTKKKASSMRAILSGKPEKVAKKKVVNLGAKGSFKVRKGALHRALGIPAGEKIGAARIKAALHSNSPETRRMAASAEGLTHMKH